MRFTLIIALFISFSSQLLANEFPVIDYSKIDSLAKTIRKRNNIALLSQKLTSPYKTDIEKYRSIFTWMCHNISYDCVALKNRSKKYPDAKTVLRQGRGVCSGYSKLFKALCEASNLECESISGWAKNSTNDIDKTLSKKSNHAWSAIKINEKWYLCDVTWGAGSTMNNCNEFNFDFKDYYFCTPTDLFSLMHYPEDTKWLLNHNLTREEFISTPKYYPTSFKMKLNALNQNKGTLKYSRKKSFDFKFKVEGKIERVSIRLKGQKKSQEVEFVQTRNTIEFNYSPKRFSKSFTIFVNNKAFLAYKMKK